MLLRPSFHPSCDPPNGGSFLLFCSKYNNKYSKMVDYYYIQLRINSSLYNTYKENDDLLNKGITINNQYQQAPKDVNYIDKNTKKLVFVRTRTLSEAIMQRPVLEPQYNAETDNSFAIRTETFKTKQGLYNNSVFFEKKGNLDTVIDTEIDTVIDTVTKNDNITEYKNINFPYNAKVCVKDVMDKLSSLSGQELIVDENYTNADYVYFRTKTKYYSPVEVTHLIDEMYCYIYENYYGTEESLLCVERVDITLPR